MKFFCIVNKAAKYETQKPSTCRATLFRCKFLSMFPVSPCVIHLSRNKNIRCGLKKVVAKSRAWVSFEQQILALLLVFHQTYNLSRNKFVRALQINQSARRISSWSHKVKNGQHRQKLATKQCCATSWGFLYLVFRRLNTTEKNTDIGRWTQSLLFWRKENEIDSFCLAELDLRKY